MISCNWLVDTSCRRWYMPQLHSSPPIAFFLSFFFLPPLPLYIGKLHSVEKHEYLHERDTSIGIYERILPLFNVWFFIHQKGGGGKKMFVILVTFEILNSMEGWGKKKEEDENESKKRKKEKTSSSLKCHLLTMTFVLDVRERKRYDVGFRLADITFLGYDYSIEIQVESGKQDRLYSWRSWKLSLGQTLLIWLKEASSCIVRGYR